MNVITPRKTQQTLPQLILIYLFSSASCLGGTATLGAGPAWTCNTTCEGLASSSFETLFRKGGTGRVVCSFGLGTCAGYDGMITFCLTTPQFSPATLKFQPHAWLSTDESPQNPKMMHIVFGRLLQLLNELVKQSIFFDGNCFLRFSPC